MDTKAVAKEIMASISKLACLCFPGFLLMETVFQRGLFSGGVDTVYQFVLFVFWSVALSIPFVFVPLIVFLVRFAPHWAIDGNQEKQKNMFYMMGHPYVFISSFICYFLVKLGALLGCGVAGRSLRGCGTFLDILTSRTIYVIRDICHADQE